jgi:pimeloyl-ACP methyl ester carboxylesterase
MMSKITINGYKYYYEEHGEGPEAILFIHGLMLNCHIYDRQVEALKDRYRCILFDLRGQGASEVSEKGYGIYDLVDDTAGLIEQLECAPCHVAGLSMGGFIAMRLAKRYPELVRSLILICTSAAAESKSGARNYKLLGFIHNRISQSFAVGKITPILFGEQWLNDPSRKEVKAYWHEQMLNNDKYAFGQTLNSILTRDDFASHLPEMDLPVLIISGQADAAIDPAQSERMHAEFPNSKLVRVPGTGHTPPVEAPDVVSEAMREFLVSLPVPDAKALA